VGECVCGGGGPSTKWVATSNELHNLSANDNPSGLPDKRSNNELRSLSTKKIVWRDSFLEIKFHKLLHNGKIYSIQSKIFERFSKNIT